MDAIKNLLGSEKGLIGALLIIGVTVLAAMGQVDFNAWQDYTFKIFGIYVAGKTVQGAVSVMADAKVNAAANIAAANATVAAATQSLPSTGPTASVVVNPPAESTGE